MSDLRARLEASLSTTYRLERELGSGGMAVVYLAHDLRHKRRVALKVLRPEISAVIGPERFLREIETLANLTHPHILPLHDSGEANGLLYYVMPYVDGDSLRERLQREKQLPLDDALRIAREVADALSHAHGRGVIHRDIKPENILISGGHALVADFGIAAAIDVAADSRLTETGIAMGTPAYMSPEQALGKRTVDARTDIYALGCVLYEMLAGEPPFNGPTAQAMIARRLHEPIPSLRIIRDNVPLSIESALTKALARSPVDRFATAEHFAKALGKSGTAEPARGIVSRVGLRRIGYALSALALVAVVITFVSFVRSPEPAASLDDKLILVLPFRLVTDDSTLASHRQGSMELLTTKINATDVLRAVDPVQTLAALGSRRSGSEIGRTDARRLARQQGAASIVSGSIVVAQGRATVAVTFTEVANQRHGSVDVTGPVDSLNSLMDEIANKALLLAVGEREDRLQTLPTRSFPALKEYVAGVVAPTRAAGTPHFDQALRYDSTFALVALRLWDGATSTVDFGLPTEAFRLAFKARDKLSERDQDHLLALVGPRYPEESWVTERLQGIERALGPSERGELWVEKADWLFHQGGAIGMDKPLDAARRAFGRAMVGGLVHQVEIASMLGDTAALDKLVDRAIAENLQPNLQTFFVWVRATVMDDRPTLDSLRATLPSAPRQSLSRIVYRAEEQGIGVADGRIALKLLGDSASTALEQLNHLERHIRFAANQGRPAEAARAAQTGTPMFAATQRVWGALYMEMDTVGIGPSISRIHARSHPDTAEGRRIESLCTLEIWRVEHGDYRSAESTVQQLRRARIPGQRIVRELCPHIIEALVEARDQRSTRALEALDSLARLGPLGPVRLRQVANIILARLHDKRGVPQRALAAVRRRGNLGSEGHFLATFLREEGRLAVMVGDTAGAIKAYRHYLALRYDPEPAVRNEVERIRAELRRLGPDEPR